MSEARRVRIEMLKQFLEEDENDLFSRYALALETMDDDVTTAVVLLEDVITRNPAFLAAYYQLGKLREALGRNEAALEAYRTGAILARQQEDLKTENELKTAASMLAEDV